MRGALFGTYVILTACGSQESSDGEAKEPPVAVAPPAAVDEPAVWLRGARFDTGQYNRDRLQRGLIADQPAAPYSDEPLTDLTNVDTAPYKSPSQERLEKARARALEAEEEGASEVQNATSSRQPDVEPSPSGQKVTSPFDPEAKDSGVNGEPADGEGRAPQSPKPAKAVASEERPADPAPKQPVVPARESAFATSAIRIQLSSVRAKADAEREGARLQRLYREILAGKDILIENVDLGAEGMFHRVQYGPFTNFATAEEACARLKALRQDCFVLTGRSGEGGG